MGLTLAGATALSAGINALGGLFSNSMNAQYNAKEAQKDRDFQERMYNQQVQDNINFWKMQQDFNLPSAQLARIREAGLNPLLAYQGQMQNVATAAPESAKAPSGSTARTTFNNPIDLPNLALLEAQIKNISADTQVKRNEAKNLSNQDEFYQLTKDLDIAKKHGDLTYLNESIHNLATQTDCLSRMTESQLETLAQSRLYQIKYYDLDEKRVENQIWYNIEQISLGHLQVSVELKKVAVALMEAKTHQFQAQTDRYRAKTERMDVENRAKVYVAEIAKLEADKNLTDQEKLNKMVDFLREYEQYDLFRNAGTDDLGILGSLLFMSGNLSGRIGGNQHFFTSPPYNPGTPYQDYYKSGQ